MALYAFRRLREQEAAANAVASFSMPEPAIQAEPVETKPQAKRQSRRNGAAGKLVQRDADLLC
jgi:hypothetical protein